MEHQTIAEVLGNWGEFIGSIAVLLTLGFLTYQIRQNTASLKRSEANAAMEQVTNYRFAMAENEELAALYLRGLDSYSDLPPVGKLRFDALMGIRFWTWHEIWNRDRSQLSDSSYWGAITIVIGDCFRNRGAREWWGTVRNQYPLDFVAIVESIQQESSRD